MSELSDRVIAALESNKGVPLPAIQQLMQEVWAEGFEEGYDHGNASAKWFAPPEPVNPYKAKP